MAYNSNFINIPLDFVSYTYTEEGEEVKYTFLASVTLERIVNIIQAHWKVETVRTVLGSRSFSIPLLKNENLPCGFTWVYFQKKAYLLIIDTDNPSEKKLINQKGYDILTSLRLCMPNAQNLLFRTFAGDYEYFVNVTALQDINSQTKAFSSFLITAENVGDNYHYDNVMVAVSLSNFDDEVFSIAENTSRDDGISKVYTTEGAIRSISDAVLYTDYTVFESNNQLFFSPYDTGILQSPTETKIGEVDYIGFNHNPTAQKDNQPSWYKFNYYLRIQKED